jgi:hypothetical protein
MGTIVGRTRKDGSKAFTAQIVIKRGGVIVHREAETFDRKQAANAWIVKREGELKRPDGFERKEDPTLAVVIDRYIKESRKPGPRIQGANAQCICANTVPAQECSRSYKYLDCRSIVVSTPSRSKLDFSQSSARSRPILRRCCRKSQSPFSLLEFDMARMTSSPSIE